MSRNQLSTSVHVGPGNTALTVSAVPRGHRCRRSRRCRRRFCRCRVPSVSTGEPLDGRALALHEHNVSLLNTPEVFVAMMIFLIASMDNPFRREFGVPPDAVARFRLQPTLFT